MRVDVRAIATANSYRLAANVGFRAVAQSRRTTSANSVASREVDRALCLNVEEGVGPVGVDRIDRYIVEGAAVRGLLKANLASDRARKAARLAAGQQRKKIESADLALEIEGLPGLRPPAALPAEYLNSLGSSRAHWGG